MSEKERVAGVGKKKKKNVSTDRDRRQLRGVAARNTWHAYVPARGARRIFFMFLNRPRYICMRNDPRRQLLPHRSGGRAKVSASFFFFH